MSLSIMELGRLIAVKRDGRGVRAVASDVGISPATLSRVENGNMPDLVTFAKICKWLDLDPREFLGLEARADEQEPPHAIAHFRKKKTVSPDTATALGELILVSQRALQARAKLMNR